MAIRKILGIETEYGIITRGAEESNPIAASSTLVRAYATEVAGQPGRTRGVGWDFEDEMPGNDARGESLVRSYAPEVETHLVNAVLTNGSRFYVDHAHPELSTPECSNALQALLYDRAGEEILLKAMAGARNLLPEGQEILVYKNNSDGKGQSYGTHENYLLARSLPFGRIVTHAITHFVTRQIYTGAGKLGTEVPGHRTDEVPYQLTQRADFFEEEVGLETTLKRPIVNTRDEPHADAKKYRRLHVIVGDANMSEAATFLKLVTTAMWFAAVEDGAVEREWRFARPVQALRQVSRDLELSQPIEMADGTSMTALEIQWELLALCRDWAERFGLDAVGEEAGRQGLALWEETLAGLEDDPANVADIVDWVAKLRVIDGFRRRHDLRWNAAKLRAMDLQYHDLRPEKSLARRVGLRTLLSREAVANAITEPPADTRAWFRGRCLQRFSDQIVAANWDSMVFDVGAASLQRVPMMEPSRGTRDHVGKLVEEATSAADLIARLAT
ncbi:MAG: proteasome accessory factor PafA2 [Microthrixaceae bacterium]|nr:proteasome accessory factor PafA2 [Microthrixaceae bacterium]